MIDLPEMYKNLNCGNCKKQFEWLGTVKSTKSITDVSFEDNCNGVLVEEYGYGMLSVICSECGTTTDFKVSPKKD